MKLWQRNSHAKLAPTYCCGINHSFMPSSVYAVRQQDFKNWVSCVQGEQAEADFPARACVQALGLDKYRNNMQSLAQVTGDKR